MKLKSTSDKLTCAETEIFVDGGNNIAAVGSQGVLSTSTSCDQISGSGQVDMTIANASMNSTSQSMFSFPAPSTVSVIDVQSASVSKVSPAGNLFSNVVSHRDETSMFPRDQISLPMGNITAPFFLGVLLVSTLLCLFGSLLSLLDQANTKCLPGFLS